MRKKYKKREHFLKIIKQNLLKFYKKKEILFKNFTNKLMMFINYQREVYN